MNDGIKKNFIYQTIYEILILILPLLTSPYIARVLGAEKLGVYSFSYSIAYYFQILCALGIKYHGSRTIAAVKDNKERLNEKFNELLFAHFFVSIISIIIYTFYSAFLVKDNSLIARIQILNVIAALLDISWFYFGIEKFKVAALSSSIIKILTVICIFLFVKKPQDLYIYTIIMSVGVLLTNLIMWRYLFNFVSIKKPNLKKSFSHLKQLIILFIPVIALSMFHYMDKIMLGILSTKIQTGLYENADKIITVPLTIIFSFSTVMLPRMSNLKYNNENEKSKKYMKLSFQYMEWLALGMSFGLFCVADKFSLIFWGKEFIPCGNLIKVLAFSLPFSTYSSIIRTQYLMPNHDDKAYTIIMVIGAIVNLILNLILVSYFEAIGVAIGTLISEFLVCFIQTIYTKNKINHLEYLKKIIPYLFPSLVMLISIMIIDYLTPSKIIFLVLEIVAGAIIYFLISLIIFCNEKGNIIIEFIKKILKKKVID